MANAAADRGHIIGTVVVHCLFLITSSEGAASGISKDVMNVAGRVYAIPEYWQRIFYGLKKNQLTTK